jgi:hypothetical protein
VIYMEILKARNDMNKSPLLFHRKFRKDLETARFEVNPHDFCVASKIVGGKQLTVALLNILLHGSRRTMQTPQSR